MTTLVALIRWSRSGLPRVAAIFFGLIVSTIHPATLLASEPAVGSAIPHVSEKARQAFVQYRYASDNKAFAIAPGGAWYWVTETVSAEYARQQAIDNCQKYTQQKCVLYALNDRVVFDEAKWSSLWGPYSDAESAAAASVGVKVGQRFPDLSWSDADGSKSSVSALRGKITFLHFWGSWCPPCLREFPSLKTLHSELAASHAEEVEMVMLQLREAFDESMLWVKEYGFSGMPIYDSGVADSETTMLTLSDGSKINDRYIARVFPSTYVLDRNGIVIFSHHGPVADWSEYLVFFEHAVKAVESLAAPATKIDKSSGS